MSLLQGGGINVAGKRIPLSLLAVVAAVGAALLIVSRLRQSGSAVAIGAPPVDLSGSGQVLLDQLNSTTQSLQAAVGQLSGAAAAAASQGTGTPINQAAPNFGQVTGDIGGGFIHSAPDPAANVLGFFSGTPLKISGAPVQGGLYASSGPRGVASNQYIPVAYAGGTGYIWAPEAQVTP